MSGIMSRLVNDRDQLERATAHLDPPFAVVDLAAFDANAHDLVRRANGVPIRVDGVPSEEGLAERPGTVLRG